MRDMASPKTTPMAPITTGARGFWECGLDTVKTLSVDDGSPPGRRLRGARLLARRVRRRRPDSAPFGEGFVDPS